MIFIKLVSSFNFFWTFVVTAGIAIITCIAMPNKTNQAGDKHRCKGRRVIITTTNIICIVLTLMLGISHAIARSHGLTSTDLTLGELYDGIANTPSDDSNNLPTNLTGRIVIFYEFGDEDFETIYPDLKMIIEPYADIYWVSIKSNAGKALAGAYSVTDTPCAMYIRENANGATTHVTKTLALTSADGDIILDTDAINRLLYLQANDI